MNVLIVGGSGIISSEICKRLLNRNNCVTILNRGKRRDMIDLRAKLIIADIRNDSLEKIESNLEPNYDVVIDFITYDTVQLEKSLVLFKNRCKQYVFISSATIYSETEDVPYDEETTIGDNSWDYSRKKAECERYLCAQRDFLPCEYTIIRPYVTYGKTRIPYQFCPTEYYTLVNRIVNKKPIPILERKNRCTLTNSREFAIGAVGLLLNEKAYGEAFHITCSYSLTWEEVIRTVARKLNKDITLVSIPENYLREHKNDAGFDVDEILGDKGRDMVFDNSKIRNAVPDFAGEVQFEEGIAETLEYYLSNQEVQIVNYRWDACVDRMLTNFVHDRKINKKLGLSAYKETMSKSVKKQYLLNRFWILNKVKAFIRWVSR